MEMMTRSIRGILINANNWVQEVCFLCDLPIHLGTGPHEKALQQALLRLPRRLFYPHLPDAEVKDVPNLRWVRVQTCKKPGFVMVQLDMPRREDDNHLGFCVLKNPKMKFLNGPVLVLASPGRGPCNPDLRFGEFLQAFQDFFPEKLRWERRDMLDLRPAVSRASAAAKSKGKGPLVPTTQSAPRNVEAKGKGKRTVVPPKRSAPANAQRHNKWSAGPPQSATAKSSALQPLPVPDRPMDPSKWLSQDVISTPSGGSRGSSSVEDFEDELPHDPTSWLSEHVAIFISRLDPAHQDADTRRRYDEYAELFDRGGYDGTSLPLLTRDILKDMGIKGGPCQVILKAIKELYPEAQ